jgi:fructose-1-phosphate kinase PfkB-like protein
VVELLQDEGLHLDAVTTGGEARAASIVLERSGRVTVLNEPGSTIGQEDWRAFEAAVAERLSGHRFLVCIGSTPPGSPPDAYGRLVRLARDRGVSSLVDASGESLANALEAGPDLVSPNLAEAEGILAGAVSQPAAERSPEVKDRALDAAAAMVTRGAAAAVVTAGAGVAVGGPSEPRWIDAPRVTVRNPIGAGDSLVGGLVGSLERGDNFREALALGVAAASASVETDQPGLIGRERVLRLRRRLSFRDE